MTRWLADIVTISVALALLGGCAGRTGPRQTGATPMERDRAAQLAAIERARSTFDLAKSAGGEFAAPFDYYLADEYIRLAMKEAREGDKVGVIVFAEQSAIHAEKAIRVAGEDER